MEIHSFYIIQINMGANIASVAEVKNKILNQMAVFEELTSVVDGNGFLCHPRFAV